MVDNALVLADSAAERSAGLLRRALGLPAPARTAAARASRRRAGFPAVRFCCGHLSHWFAARGFAARADNHPGDRSSASRLSGEAFRKSDKRECSGKKLTPPPPHRG